MMRQIFILFLGLAMGNGMIAQDYFQQEVDYTIQVSLDDVAHELNGMMELHYKNNSPDALEFIYFHLWPNAYSDFNTCLSEELDELGQFNYHFSDKEDRGNIRGFRWTVDGEEAAFEFQTSENSDQGKLILKQALAPGSTCIIRTPFQVKIPSGAFSRLGHLGNSYQITQWYPKPAVYDNKGWHSIPYLNQGEFYSEFGSFKVSITLPANYIVGATGVLQEAEEYEYMKLISKREPIQDSNEFPVSVQEKKTLTYVQDKVHDFAWFADKRFNILYDKVELPESKDSIDAWVLYTNNHKEAWMKSMEYVQGGIQHYSKYVGDYPYSQVTVIDGTLSAGGGMEYPMITVINGTSDDMALEDIIVHEIGHNWFYGILGSNERDHAWMDEGINTYYESRYFEEKYHGQSEAMLAWLGIDGRQLHEIGYLYNARKHQDQDLDLSSSDFTSLNYATMVYSKGGYIMEHLSSVIGQEEYDQAMHDYFKTWGFHHPYPEDLQKSFEKSTGKDLSWFNTYLSSGNKKLDYSLKASSALGSEKLELTLRECSGTDVPVKIGMFKGEERVGEMVLAPGQSLMVSPEEIEALIIDPDRQALDMNRHDNRIKTKGLFKTCQGPQLKFLSGFGNTDVPTLYVLPIIGRNGTDGLMPGLSISNVELLSKDFEYSFMPMYGLDSGFLTGLASLNKRFFFTDGPSNWNIGIRAKRFASGDTINLNVKTSLPNVSEVQSYDVIAEVLKPYVSYEYIPASLKQGTHTFSYTAHVILSSFPNFNSPVQLVNGLTIEPPANRDEVFHALDYSFELDRALRKTWVKAMLEGHQDYLKLEASLAMDHVYNEKKDKICWRVYGAKLWKTSDGFAPIGSSVNLNGQDGYIELDGSSDDYRYDALFFDRGAQSGFSSQQMVNNRGGFTQKSPYGRSENYVASLNLTADLPIPLPLSLYANFGIYQSWANSEKTKDHVNELYEAGIRFSLVKDMIDISFPLVYSQEVRDYYAFYDIKYGQTIRFQFRLERMGIKEFRNALDL